MRCRDATITSLVAEFRGEDFANFHAFALYAIVVCRIDCLACQDEFFVKNLLDVKDNYDHTLEFALQLSRFFGLDEFGLYVYGSCFLPRMLV
jgi:hypothetical protein